MDGDEDDVDEGPDENKEDVEEELEGEREMADLVVSSDRDESEEEGFQLLLQQAKGQGLQ
eukprot:8461618-Karenia_brevis.AAC.1